MTRSTVSTVGWLLVWVASFAVLASGCRKPPAGTARVLKATPSGVEVSADDARDGVRVVFDRDVAPEGRVGQPLPKPALTFEPALAGESRWLDARTLAFFPREKLRPSTAYTVELARDVPTSPRVALGTWKGLSFVHERVELHAVTFDGDRDYQAVRPLMKVVASQAMSPAVVASACVFRERSGGDEVQAAPARATFGPDDDEGAARGPSDPSRAVAITSARELRAATPYVLRCGAALVPAGGTVGLASPREEAFTTHGPAGIKKVSPSGSDVAADGVRVLVEFATPMDPDAVRRHVTLTTRGQAARPLDLAADARRVSFTWSGDLESDVEYEVVIAGGLRDVFGQALSRDEVRHGFKVGDASPRLRTERGIFVVERASPRYPVFTRNLPSFELRCARVPEAKLTAVLTGPANYDAWWDVEPGEADWTKLGLRVHTHQIAPRAARNRWHDDSIDLARRCGEGRAGGVYLLEMTTVAEHDGGGQVRPRGRRSLASVTDLGLLAKVGNASSLVWVVRLSTGEPVAGAAVKIRDLTGKLRFSGRSDADGVVAAPGATKLVGVRPVGETNATGEDDGEGEGDWDSNRARRVIVTAEAAGDQAVLDTNWNNGIQVWNFAATEDRRGGETRVRGFLQSDRGLYRPGDVVHLRGLARVVSATGAMTLPRKRRVHVVVEDPRGTSLVEKDLTLSPFGGFSLDVTLASEARLGDYRVRGQIEGQTFNDDFSVEEYRPRTFEVKVKTPRANVALGDKLKFDLQASYLYGSPLRAGKVTWSVRRRLHLTRFPGFDEYAFQDLAALYDGGRWWARWEERSFSEPVADAEVALDAAGKVTVTTRDDAKEAQPQDYLFEATVEDASGQAVTTGATVTAHPGELYLGLHPSEFVQAVDMPFGVQVVAFDREGARRAADVELTLVRRTYDCGTGWSGCKRHEDAEPALRRKVSVPAAGSAAVERVVVKLPGEYVVSVRGSDGRGHETVTSEEVWVIGPGEAFWSGDEGDRMTLVASKMRYQAGETARLVPQARLSGALALATLERDGILWHKVERLATAGQAVEVPVDGRYAPNVYASVALVRGRQGEGDAGRPRFQMGLVNLEVDTAGKRLGVVVSTDKPSYRPGEKVTARLEVKTATGEPVRAELAVAVADEGVLQIKGYKTPDPMASFYAAWGLGVESATTWNRVLRRHDPSSDDDDEEGGDAGGDDAGRIRSRFMATAFWAPAVVTGADGAATVTFTAPDNLTAFRVMAVGGDPGDRFGSGERRFTVNKPLQAVPALPRFLTVGDEAQAAVLLSNNTKAPFEATVRLAAEGVALSGPPAQTVKLGAGANARVGFAVAAAREGRAKLVFKVTGGGHADAVLAELPVQRPSVPEALVVGEGAAKGRASHALPALGAIVPDHGELEVTLDVTGLSRLDEGLRYLVGYPYGCLEQTTSKVVPMVALGELARTVELPGVATGKARGYVEAGLAKIVRHQHDDGGFGLWIGAPPEVHYTAYALWGLLQARAAGYTIDQRVLDAGAGYLKRFVDGKPAGAGSVAQLAAVAGDRAFAYSVLASLDKADAGGLERLFEERAQLPVYGRAFLAHALFAAGQGERARTLAGELAALARSGLGPVVLRETERELDWYWSSDVRSTALVLAALLEIAPGDPVVARLGQGLIAARHEGRWSSTQENLYSLVALASLAKTRAAGGEVPVTVTVGAGRPRRQVVSAGAVVRLRVPLDGLGQGPLVIDTGDREIFYAARVHVERPLDGAAVDHGLAVTREYLDPDTGKAVAQARLGQTIKVRVTLRSPVRRAHVAVVDRLPAGFEPVITRFRSSYAGSELPDRRGFWWWHAETAWQNLELRDDRAQLFADVVAAGESRHEYLVRATTVGSFSAPPATTEAMYEPSVAGRSAAAKVTVTR